MGGKKVVRGTPTITVRKEMELKDEPSFRRGFNIY